MDAVFTGFWLSHVARERLDGVPRAGPALAQARWHVRVHRLAARSAVERRRPPDARRRPAVRRLDDGREFTIVKVYYRPGRARGCADRRRLPGRRRSRPPAGSSCSRPRSGADPARRSAARGTHGPDGRDPVLYSAAMSPLTQRTIATVGSGMMAEAMIGGLLRGGLVEPGQVVASHPRAERREHLAREYGIRRVALERRGGPTMPTSSCSPSSPRCSARVGREIGPQLRRGQLVLSVLAGATTRGADRDPRPRPGGAGMPNTPARLGEGMTVWYATPETTAEQRGWAAALLGRARRGDRGRRREDGRDGDGGLGHRARPTCSWSWRR